MRILLIDNGFIGKNKLSFYISGSTNDFINDLTKLGIDVNLMQFHKEMYAQVVPWFPFTEFYEFHAKLFGC